MIRKVKVHMKRIIFQINYSRIFDDNRFISIKLITDRLVPRYFRQIYQVGFIAWRFLWFEWISSILNEQKIKLIKQRRKWFVGRCLISWHFRIVNFDFRAVPLLISKKIENDNAKVDKVTQNIWEMMSLLSVFKQRCSLNTLHHNKGKATKPKRRFVQRLWN